MYTYALVFGAQQVVVHNEVWIADFFSHRIRLENIKTRSCKEFNFV